jgi:DNA-binding MltR family transcriptional regulator
MPKKDPTQHRRKLRDFNILFQELQGESDRAAAVLGAAFLDGLLEEYITNFLIDDTKEVEGIFGPDKPLGSFGARITMCFCLGLISQDEKHDLRIIQRVRNRFAHELTGISFDDKGIADSCSNLKIPTKVASVQELIRSSVRERYIAATAFLVTILTHRTIEISNARRVTPGERKIVIDFEKDS